MTAELSRKRAAAGRLGGLATSSRHDVKLQTQPATAAFLARFEREVDPENALPVAERERRATAARKAYYVRLQLRSAAVRAARKGAAR